MYDIMPFAHRYRLEAVHSYRQGRGFSHSFLHPCVPISAMGFCCHILKAYHHDPLEAFLAWPATDRT